MKIATWNIERLKHSNKLDNILNEIKNIDADILILTETDTRANPDHPFHTATESLPTDYYLNSERRVAIFSKFEIVGVHKTYDRLTTICPEIKTPLGNLLVYGTIIGIHGNIRASFKEDLEKQLIDFKQLGNQNLCIAGDFNLSFSDNYYFTKYGREALNTSFAENQMVNLSAHLPESIDHICLSKKFLGNGTTETFEWNQDKSLSDHKGVCVSIQS